MDHGVFRIQYFYFRIFRNSGQHQSSEKMRNKSKIVIRVILALLFIRSPKISGQLFAYKYGFCLQEW